MENDLTNPPPPTPLVETCLNGPCSHFIFSSSKEVLKVESLVTSGDDLLKCTKGRGCVRILLVH